MTDAPAHADAPRECTVARAAELAGVGLHTGAVVRVRVSPAPAGQGIVFVRTDLPGAVAIPAAHRAVSGDNLQRRTELSGPGGATVATVEHLLAACRGLGIDNLCVELDGPEIPIVDGSAQPFVELLDRAGRAEQAPPRRHWRLRGPVSLVREDAEIHAIPAERPSFAFFAMLEGLGMRNQSAEVALDRVEEFRARVAPARTWVRFEDVERLRAAGLIKGGSADCAIVLRDGAPINTEYRLGNELAAHKLLDLIGDFAILGCPLDALVTARASGHEMHHEFVGLLTKELTE